MKQALQWWCEQQSRELTWEARQIRDQLLQESFVIRRSLELLLAQSDRQSITPYHQWLEQFESFHVSLQGLSDRLSPPYIEEGLPLAMEYLIQNLKRDKSQCEFQLQLPNAWQNKSIDKAHIILKTLDKLLRIELSESIEKTVVLIQLKQNNTDNQLMINLDCSTSSQNMSSDKFRELAYLSQSFKILTSGTCEHQLLKSNNIWYFQWSD